MAVYVDDMRAPYGRMIMCHMLADTPEELHTMADRIGVARKWFQGDHYDVCLSKRALAVKYGAREINRREAVVIWKRFRGELRAEPEPELFDAPPGRGACKRRGAA